MYKSDVFMMFTSQTLRVTCDLGDYVFLSFKRLYMNTQVDFALELKSVFAFYGVCHYPKKKNPRICEAPTEMTEETLINS